MIPNISICIATKNRSKYAACAIRSILSIDREDFEIVVQDNSDNSTELPSLLRGISDTRLRYLYTPPPLSSIDNFRLTIERSRGKYVCLIGDDDAVLSDLFIALDLAIEHNIDCIVGSLSLNYRWPGTGIKKTLFTDTSVGGLTISGFNCQIKAIDQFTSLKGLMKNGATNYLKFDLPKFYHGLIKRECFEKIKEITGNYIGGLSPDIYTATALSLVSNKIIKIDYPLTMPGVCAESTSVSEGNFKSVGTCFNSAPHFRDRGKYSRSELVPDVYCLETIWADSCIAALTDMNKLEYLKYFNQAKLISYVCTEHPELKPIVFNYFKNKFPLKELIFIWTKSMILKIPVYFELRLTRYINRLFIILKIKKHKNLYNIKDIDQAVNFYEEYKINSIGVKLIKTSLEKYLNLR